jgi:PIN domain nuclease of toxin-antitoxin system
MRILLDTHILIWVLLEPRRLSERAKEVIESEATQVLFSAVSIWEIAIKARIGRPGFIFRPGEIALSALGSGFIELPIRSDAAAQVADLPLLHRDPFDRLLVAQAMTEPAGLLTGDAQLLPYSELVRLLDAL